MTSPRERGRAELEHPSWCDAGRCPIELMGAGLRHQSREVVVFGDDGGQCASVVLQQAPRGRLLVAMFSRTQSWSPHVARRVGEALIRLADVADGEQQPG